jgi:hypothetical protein
MNTEIEDEAPLPHNDGAKTQRIDLGLAILSALARPRATFEQEDIAAFCGCTKSYISHIETRALRRLRKKVAAQFDFSGSDLGDLRRWMDLHFRS